MNPLSLMSLPQKLALGGMAAALAGAAFFNVYQAVEIRHLTKSNNQFDQLINDKQTGYVVKLAQAETNNATCVVAMGRQSAAVRAQSEKDKATIAAVQGQYDREHIARTRAEKAAAVFLAREPRGATPAERFADVDAQILEDLK